MRKYNNIKKIIRVTEELDDQLKTACELTGESEAAIIRVGLAIILREILNARETRTMHFR